MTAHARLRALSDLDLDGIRRFQIFRRHAVTVSNVLKNVFFGCLHFLRQDTAFAGAHGTVGQRGAHCQ